MKSLGVLTKTELKLSLRNFDSIFFGVVMPIIILTIINFVSKDILTNNFGAYLSIGICAIGLMALPLTLSDYREKKILKRLKVTPVKPQLLLFVQFIVQSFIALISALITGFVGIVLFKYEFIGDPLQVILAYCIVLISIFSIGLLLASISPTLKIAGYLCSLLYFPMLIFSGTTVPLSSFPEIIQKISMILPLTQGIKLLGNVLKGDMILESPFQLLILGLISIISIALSVKNFKWE